MLFGAGDLTITVYGKLVLRVYHPLNRITDIRNPSEVLGLSSMKFHGDIDNER